MKKRMHFRVSHRDKAERAIITALRSVGASVYQVNGKDIPDLLVGFRGVTTLLEVKSRLLSEEKGRAPRMRTTKVSEGQKEFAASWRGGTSAVAHDPREALVFIRAPHDGRFQRWVAENGAYLCEQCWLPENGLHAKDCPTRLALKRPPKVETAYRAAKKAREVLPEPPGPLPHTEEWRKEWAQTVAEHRKSRGVEGELQPTKVRVPPRVETCLCGHTASEHWDGEKSCAADGGCPCATFIERR